MLCLADSDYTPSTAALGHRRCLADPPSPPLTSAYLRCDAFLAESGFYVSRREPHLLLHHVDKVRRYRV